MSTLMSICSSASNWLRQRNRLTLSNFFPSGSLSITSKMSSYATTPPATAGAILSVCTRDCSLCVPTPRAAAVARVRARRGSARAKGGSEKKKTGAAERGDKLTTGPRSASSPPAVATRRASRSFRKRPSCHFSPHIRLVPHDRPHHHHGGGDRDFRLPGRDQPAAVADYQRACAPPPLSRVSGIPNRAADDPAVNSALPATSSWSGFRPVATVTDIDHPSPDRRPSTPTRRFSFASLSGAHRPRRRPIARSRRPRFWRGKCRRRRSVAATFFPRASIPDLARRRVADPHLAFPIPQQLFRCARQDPLRGSHRQVPPRGSGATPPFTKTSDHRLRQLSKPRDRDSWPKAILISPLTPPRPSSIATARALHPRRPRQDQQHPHHHRFRHRHDQG